MLIIPAIDLKQGRCVRLRQGKEDAETRYSDDPVNVARRWEEQGAEWIHVVDLDGAFTGRPQHLPIIRKIASAVTCKLEVGGGIRTEQAVREVLEAGTERVVIGTRAVTDFDWFKNLCEQHPGRIVAGVDAKNGIIATKGWTATTEWRAVDFVRQLDCSGVAAVIFTDIAKDGMLKGPNIASVREIARISPVPVIASGGISSLEDIKKLAAIPVDGAIIGKALYDGCLSLQEAIAIAQATIS